MRGNAFKYMPALDLTPGGKCLEFQPAILLRVRKDGSTFILRDAGNGLPKPHTDVCFDLSIRENTRMQLGERRVCTKEPRGPRPHRKFCESLVRWLPIENGTGAISCQWHGEIPFAHTRLAP